MWGRRGGHGHKLCHLQWQWGRGGQQLGQHHVWGQVVLLGAYRRASGCQWGREGWVCPLSGLWDTPTSVERWVGSNKHPLRVHQRPPLPLPLWGKECSGGSPHRRFNTLPCTPHRMCFPNSPWRPWQSVGKRKPWRGRGAHHHFTPHACSSLPPSHPLLCPHAHKPLPLWTLGHWQLQHPPKGVPAHVTSDRGRRGGWGAWLASRGKCRLL